MISSIQATKNSDIVRTRLLVFANGCLVGMSLPLLISLTDSRKKIQLKDWKHFAMHSDLQR